MSRPTIALCVIARDEERFIADCLDSARPFVDEIVVLDTGSVDRTREIAREHGARVVEFTWIDDFAAARNAAIDAATSEWVFMLDADERLEPTSGAVLRGLPARLPASVHGGCPRIESRSLSDPSSYSIAGQVPRFFRRSPDIRYRGAIHEDLAYAPDPAATRNVVINDLVVAHYGYDSTVYAERNKDQRNTELLERQLAEHPEDARLLYFLGQQHHAMGRHEQALEWYARFLKASDGVRSEFVVEAHTMRLASLNALERDEELELAAPALEAARLLSAAACETLASFEARRNNLAAACGYLERALGADLATGVTSDAGTGGWATRLRLAELYERSGDPNAALEELERAYRDLAPRARAVVSLQALGLAVRAEAPLDALRWLPRARADAPDEVEAQTQLVERALEACALTPLANLDPLEQALAEEDWQAAYDLAVQLPTSGAGSYARLLLVASNLRVRGAADASLQLLERALDILPGDRRVYWELVRTLTDLGRFDDAENALQVLQGVSNLAA